MVGSFYHQMIVYDGYDLKGLLGVYKTAPISRN
jgi:hypothetical protein